MKEKAEQWPHFGVESEDGLKQKEMKIEAL